jgi:hypothetical protein
VKWSEGILMSDVIPAKYADLMELIALALVATGPTSSLIIVT